MVDCGEVSQGRVGGYQGSRNGIENYYIIIVRKEGSVCVYVCVCVCVKGRCECV